MDISEIRNKWYNGFYYSKIAVPVKVRSDHVFDENLSVKRNREMAAEHNEKAEAIKKASLAEQAELYNQFTNDVVAYIVDSYDISEEQARIVEGFVYTHKHHAMCDYFSFIDEAAEMAERVVEAGTLDRLEKDRLKKLPHHCELCGAYIEEDNLKVCDACASEYQF